MIKILQDLGMSYPNANSKRKYRYCIALCDCGEEFKTHTANIHNGHTTQCKVCSNNTIADGRLAKAKSSFEGKAIAVHNGKYTYENVVYTNNCTKVDITCAEHGVFSQVPNNHLQGQGCSECAVYSFKLLQPAQLYYFKILLNNQWVYKIGVTNKTWKQRYNAVDRKSITIIKTWEFELGQAAYDYEQSIMKAYKDYKYEGDTPFTDGTGTTECFSVDVYDIDIINN